MTVGEPARFFNAGFDLRADLTVVPMTGWRRGMWFDDSGLVRAPTSPAAPHLSTATVYHSLVSHSVQGQAVDARDWRIAGRATHQRNASAPSIRPNALTANVTLKPAASAR